MKRSIILSLALVLTPLSARAQEVPAGPPPDAVGPVAPSQAERAQMQQFRAQMEQYHAQTRASMLAALTPQHRAAVASIIGQLALSPNPNPKAAALQLDALFAPAEKQSIVNIATAARTATRALMEQRRAAMESTLTADQKAQMAARQAKMQAFMQAHPHAVRAADPGEIVLRTLGDFGPPGGGRHFE